MTAGFESNGTADADDDHSGAESYFVPMVDMLAGVVFVLIILLAANTLVSRDDFTATRDAQVEINRIEFELRQARAAELRFFEPRRVADMALRRLVRRLSAKLNEIGIQAIGSEADGVVTIVAPPGFDPAVPELNADARRLANDVAKVLGDELPCLVARSERKDDRCAPYASARLDRARVAIRSNGPVDETQIEAKMLVFLSAMVESVPPLIALRAPDEGALLVYRGDANPSNDPSMKPGNDVASIVLDFQMAHPTP